MCVLKEATFSRLINTTSPDLTCPIPESYTWSYLDQQHTIKEKCSIQGKCVKMPTSVRKLKKATHLKCEIKFSYPTSVFGTWLKKRKHSRNRKKRPWTNLQIHRISIKTCCGLSWYEWVFICNGWPLYLSRLMSMYPTSCSYVMYPFLNLRLFIKIFIYKKIGPVFSLQFFSIALKSTVLSEACEKIKTCLGCSCSI